MTHKYVQEQQTHGVGYHAYKYEGNTFLLMGYSKSGSVYKVYSCTEC